jgi:DNA polymerase-3 subunit delta'
MSKEKYNWPKIGNDKVIDFLTRGLENNKIAQTYIFIGRDDLGKSTLALAFARNLQGNREGFNSDLHILQTLEDKKTISIEQTREFIKSLDLSSFSDSYKIGIIKEAEKLSEEAKSALLKTLEEPKDKVIIILLVAEEQALPATILSRGQILYFYPVPVSTIYDYLIDNYGANRSLAKDLANFSLGRPLLAARFLENPDDYRRYLDRAESWLNLITKDFNCRLEILNSLFSDKTWSKAALAAAGEILSLAEGLARDLLLLSLEQDERLQHSSLAPTLGQTLEYLNNGGSATIQILKQLKLIAQAREYLAANVNPRLVLEQLAVNI